MDHGSGVWIPQARPTPCRRVPYRKTVGFIVKHWRRGLREVYNKSSGMICHEN